MWANKDLFYLNDAGQPQVVAGVPPDYFSETGQLWGNPLYRWDFHAQTGYAWWLARFRAMFKLVDIVRVDHFRGFVDYWEIPGDAATAIEGRWLPGPGAGFLQTVIDELGGSADRRRGSRRDQSGGLRGSRSIRTPRDEDSPVRLRRRSSKTSFSPITTRATASSIPARTTMTPTGTGGKAPPTRSETLPAEYLGVTGEDISWDLIRAAWKSRADVAITPLQDVLGLPTSARMNFPGTLGGNWGWRMGDGAFSAELQTKLVELNAKPSAHSIRGSSPSDGQNASTIRSCGSDLWPP